APLCGDGVKQVEVGEVCDDGNGVSGDGCDNNCKPTACGNGIVTAGEQCDDGNGVNGDGCDDNCTPTVCGNGITTAGESSADSNDPVSIAVADMNGDTRLDLVVTDLTSSNLSLYFGNGDGTFQLPVSTATGGSSPIQVALGDIDGDGRPDAVVANQDSNNV